MKKFYKLTVFHLLTLVIVATLHIAQTSTDYSNCTCTWTAWMNGDDPVDDDVDDETYRSLRSKGYDFCKKPVDIQCIKAQSGLLVDNTVTCDVDIGLRCSFFCDDYKIKVKCCYCPPAAIGPIFQMISSHNQKCLVVRNNTGSSPVTKMETPCRASNIRQQWSWVSPSQIKSLFNGQCLEVNNSKVVTADCDVSNQKQWWSYSNEAKSLSSDFKYGFLSSRSGGFAASASSSRWMAKVDIGKTVLTAMKGFPCPKEPNAPRNGSVSCNFGSYLGSVCQFSCNRGFQLPSNSDSPVICLKSRQYNGTTPTCQRIVCQSSLPSASNGQATCTNGVYVDSKCQFVCEEGYRLIGDPIITCAENGKWDSPAPSCERIECQPNLENDLIEHGFVNCSNANYLSSACEYTCEAGYILQRPITRVCGQDSAWSETKPNCEKLQCTSLPTFSNGSKNCDDENFYASTCTFSCHLGYTLRGSDSLSCNSEGAWSGVSPTCERKTCSKLMKPDHGRLSCTDKNFFSSRCFFNCKEGYELVGESTLQCTASGWNHGSPNCKRIECPHLLAPINGDVSCTDKDFYGSRCQFNCDRFYDFVGPQVLVCGEKRWNSTTQTTCRKRTCPPFPKPTHGKAQCYPKEYEVNSVCFKSCNEGYKLNPPNPMPSTCTENGVWSVNTQICEKIQCRSLSSSLRNGYVSCSDRNNYQSKCGFRCKRGYNLYGSNETICGATGWTKETPTCDKVICYPQFSLLKNGNVNCSGDGVFSCSFSCKSGYNLIGADHTECQNDRTWTNPDLPTCQRVSCSVGTSFPAHGEVRCTEQNLYGSVCNYTCNHGYNLVGQNLIECMETGDWNAEPPICKRISCNAQREPSNGKIQCTDDNHFNSVCTFNCDEGYQLIGPKSIQCLLNKMWDERTPYCEGISCSPGFSNPSNGRAQCTDHNNFGSTCSFTCDTGFRLSGSKTTKCGEAGWSHNVAPTCTKITCPFETSRFTDGSESCDNSNDMSSRCVYTCNEGYELNGDNSRQCGNNGEWSHIRPKCFKIHCPRLALVDNGNTKCSHLYEFESECVTTCAVGYRRVGAEKIVCTRNKSWNPAEMPLCELIPIVSSTSIRMTVASTTTEAVPTSKLLSNSSGRVDEPPNSAKDESQANSQFPASDPGKPTYPNNTPLSEATETDDGFPVTIVAVSTAVVVLIVIIGIAVLCFRKRRVKRRPSFKGISLLDRHDDSQFQKLLSSNGSSGRRFPPILIDRLESEFSRKHADDDKLFREEFAGLPEGQGSREQGGKAVNKDKNRYTNIIPYDHSRVILPRASNNDPDYINASFIDGYKHKGKFIAAQGPKENTTNDFWRMIWDQNVTTVIMVTNLLEGKETKCAQYWPYHDSHLYGDLKVCFTGENRLVDYTVRKFTIQQVSGESTLSMRRNLVQYHFTSWPDFGVPKSPSGMLKFLRKIKHGSPTGYGAIVVHCSAGVGRTGTFICLDAMLDMMAREGKIDVYGFVTQMRGQRPEMVQTEQQYIFIYQAILEQHLYGDTEVEAADITLQIDELNKRLPGNVTGMEHEFKKLTTIRIQKEQMRAGNHPGNMRKNRVLLILPYDWNRVILPVKRGEENSDYINASYIDGYRQKDAYIATQGPLNHTVEDFWRLIWQTQSASIVMLTELIERGQAKCEQYWPNSDVMIYGDISVENIGGQQLDNYTTRDFVLTSTSDQNDRKQFVRQFHYHAWPESGPPVSGYSMIALVEQVQKQQQTSGNHPITIHCSAGAGRTGAFCALSTALEQVKAEGVLDMFQIVKCLRMQRPHMVQNLEQYEFCYRAVQEYVDSMSEYYNFK